MSDVPRPNAGAPLVEALRPLPDEALVPVGWVRAQLETAGVGAGAPDPSAAASATWRERLWSCDANVRLGVAELAEAVDRPDSWVYRHTSEKSGYERLPHRRQEGALVFVAGEIRAWLEQHEEVIARPAPVIPIARTPRRARAARGPS